MSTCASCPDIVQANPKNLTPFLLPGPDQGIRGVFNGASIVFFSYIGFDVVANTGEEVRATATAQHTRFKTPSICCMLLLRWQLACTCSLRNVYTFITLAFAAHPGYDSIKSLILLAAHAGTECA